MEAELTTERLVARYNTYTRRPTVEDAALRAVIFRSFGRVLGPWLPARLDCRILDVACGEGSLLSFLRERGYTRLEGFDLSDENVRICNGLGLRFVERFDALELAAFRPVAQYDTIFAMDILEHVPKQRAMNFLEQARSRLAPGGTLILQTPNMGSLLGLLHRYNDLSHEFGLTEKSAIDLLTLAGFEAPSIEIRAGWHATTYLGYLREIYLKFLHTAVFLADDRGRPRIPTKNLLIRATSK